jgi:hypothetical protein
MWTVYDHPTDYPDGFIARLYLAYPGFAVPTPSIVTGSTLAQVRERLPPGLYCLPRDPNDDPKIIETWI